MQHSFKLLIKHHAQKENLEGHFTGAKTILGTGGYHSYYFQKTVLGQNELVLMNTFHLLLILLINLSHYNIEYCRIIYL